VPAEVNGTGLRLTPWQGTPLAHRARSVSLKTCIRSSAADISAFVDLIYNVCKVHGQSNDVGWCDFCIPCERARNSREVFMSDEQDFHVTRARQELDLGYMSENRHAAIAHLRLAALHMSRLEDREPDLDERRLEGPRVTIHAPIHDGI
jgi:hypothetical protein